MFSHQDVIIQIISADLSGLIILWNVLGGAISRTFRDETNSAAVVQVNGYLCIAKGNPLKIIAFYCALVGVVAEMSQDCSCPAQELPAGCLGRRHRCSGE